MSDLVVVVDDNRGNQKLAARMLGKAGMEVKTLSSGRELLSCIEEGTCPDLILLDVMMPDMDGFETLKRLRNIDAGKDTPVIFLTADDNMDSETKGLSIGAMDFIKKPFLPEVLTLRVRHTIDLDHLQKDLFREVAKKTEENRKLFMHVVACLATAIDAKDTYTNGHSSRVAKYSEEIARRFGYDDQRCKEIFMMGLLHDVGKIGVPNSIINKPGRLTDEEFEIIKTHPASGARILGTINEMPRLSAGARWHHERYGGGGYPDGLVGDEIPEEARIIAVADAYDAMTSYRSYRASLPQEAVRAEIEKGKGTQFDPRFADIMLEMIDEDTEYRMKEERKDE